MRTDKKSKRQIIFIAYSKNMYMETFHDRGVWIRYPSQDPINIRNGSETLRKGERQGEGGGERESEVIGEVRGQKGVNNCFSGE